MSGQFWARLRAGVTAAMAVGSKGLRRRRGTSAPQYGLIVMIAVIASAGITAASGMIRLDFETVACEIQGKSCGLSFDPIMDAAVGEERLSSEQRLEGFSGSFDVSVSGGNAQFRVDGGEWMTSGRAREGQVLQLRVNAANDYDTSLRIYVAAGERSAMWLVHTAPRSGLEQPLLSLTFDDKLGAAPGQAIPSDIKTVLDFQGPLSVTVSGTSSPQFRIGEGDWQEGPADLMPGDTLQLRQLSNVDLSGVSTMTVRVGSLDVPWRVVTRDSDVILDIPLDQLAFAPLEGYPRATYAFSDIVRVTNFPDALPVTIAGNDTASFSINGGPYTTGPQNLRAGHTLRLQVLSADAYETAVTPTVTVGHKDAEWTVTTRDANDKPAGLSFPASVGLEPGEFTYSNPAMVRDFDGPLTLSIVAEETTATGAMFSIDGADWATEGDLVPQATVQLYAPAPPELGQTQQVTVQVGQTKAVWTLSTRQPDTLPDTFRFTAKRNQLPDADVLSDAVRLSGFDLSQPIRIAPTGVVQTAGTLQINGGASVTEGTVAAGDIVRLTGRVPSAAGATACFRVTVGTGSGDWCVSAAEPFIFKPATMLEPESPVTSVSVGVPTSATPLTAVLAGDEHAELVVNGTETGLQSMAVVEGDRIAIRTVAPAGFSEVAQVGISAGTNATTWNLATRPERDVPVEEDEEDPGEDTSTAFLFSPLSAQEREVRVLSNVVEPQLLAPAQLTLSGDGGVALEILRGDVWGAPRAAPVVETIEPGDRLRLSMTTASTYYRTRLAQAVLEGIGTARWAVTTLADPATGGASPGTLSFEPLEGMSLDTRVASNIVGLRLSAPADAVLSGEGQPELRVQRDGAWMTYTQSPISLHDGDVVQLFTTTASDFDTTRIVDVALNGDVVHWPVTTLSATTPDPVSQYFRFNNLSNQARGQEISSSLVQMALDGERRVTVSGEGNARLRIQRDGAWGATTTSATLRSGDTLQLLLDSSPQYGVTRTATATIGSMSTAWSVATQPVPVNGVSSSNFANAFGALSNVDPASTASSNAVVFTGLSGSMDIALAGPTGTTMTVDGQRLNAGASATVRNGSVLMLGTVASTEYAQAVQVTVTPSGAGWPAANWRVTTRPRDTTVDPFSFTGVTLVPPGSSQVAAATVTGFEGTVGVTVAQDSVYPGNPMVRIGAGAPVSPFSSPLPQVAAGQVVQLIVNAPSDPERRQKTYLIVGSASAAFDVTTQYDTVPTAIAFPPALNVEPGATVRAVAQSLKDFTGTLTATVSGGDARPVLNNVDSTAAAVTVAMNDRLGLKVTAPTAFDTELAVNVAIPGLPAQVWTVRTRPMATAPSPAGMAPVVGAALEGRVTSVEKVLRGFDGTIALSVSGPGNPLLSVNGRTPATQANNVLAGDKVQLSVTAGAGFLETRNVAFTEGSATTDWAVTTRAIDTDPTVPELGITTNALPSSDAHSQEIVISSFDGTLPLKLVSQAGKAAAPLAVAVDGAWYTVPGTLPAVRAGQKLQLRLSTGINHDVDYGAVLSVGAVQRVWTVRTGPDNLPEPMALTFTPRTIDPGTEYTTEERPICAFEGSMLVTLAVDSSQGAEDVPELLVNGAPGASPNQVQIDAGTGACNNGTWPRLQIRMKAAPTWSTARQASLTIGPYATGRWVLTARDRRLAVYNLGFETVPNAEVNTTVTSESRVLSGFDDEFTVRVLPDSTSGTAAPAYRITRAGQTPPNTWTPGATASSMREGDALQLQMKVAANRGQQQAVRVTVGPAATNWRARTLASEATPQNMDFGNVTNAETSTLIHSRTVRVASSVTGVLGVTIQDDDGDPATQAMISVDGGATFTDGAVNATGGTVIQLRANSAPLYGLTRRLSVVFRGMEDGREVVTTRPWTVATRTPDDTPDAFTLAPNNQTVAADSWVESNPVQIRGFDTTLTAELSVAPAASGDAPVLMVQEYGFPFWTTYEPGQVPYVSPDASIKVRLRAGTNFAAVRTLTVKIGKTSGTFVVNTRGLSAAAFTFPTLDGQPINTAVESEPVRLSGWNGSAQLTPTGAGTPLIAVEAEDGTWSAFASGQPVRGGQRVKLKVTTPNDYLLTRTVRLAVGATSGTWTVQTSTPPDSIPDSFSFEAKLDQPINTVVSSADITVLGIDPVASVTAYLTGQGSPQVRRFSPETGWSTWTSGSIGNIRLGDHIQLRATSAADYLQTRRVDVTISGIKASWAFTTRSAPDIVPDDFSFPASTGKAIATRVISESVPILGIDDGIPLSVSGDGNPLVSINGKVFANPNTVPPAKVYAGDSVRIEALTSPDWQQTRKVTLAAGSKTADWVFSTRTKPTLTPNAFAFDPATAQALTAPSYSGFVTISGIEQGFTAPASVTGDGAAAFRINGVPGTDTGPWYNVASAPPAVRSGDTLQLRLQGASDYGQTRKAEVTVGGVKATWTSTTRARPNLVPATFGFQDTLNAAINDFAYSPTVTVSGVETGFTVAGSIAGVGNPAFRVNPNLATADGPWYTAATNPPPQLKSGDIVQLRVLASSDYSQSRVATLTVGSVKANWTATTRARPNLVPSAFAFADTPNAALNAYAYSPTVTVAGVEPGFTVLASVAGQGAPAYRVNPDLSTVDGPWYTDATAPPRQLKTGDTVQLRLTASSDYGQSRVATFTVGGVKATWTASTMAAPDLIADAPVFAARVDRALATRETSETYTVAGLTPGIRVPVSIAGAGGAAFRIGAGNWVTGSPAPAPTVANGDTVTVQMTTAPGYATARVAQLSVGSVTAAWSLTTLSEPGGAAWSIRSVDNAAVSTGIASDYTVFGNTGTVTATFTMDPSSVITGSPTAYIHVYNSASAGASSSSSIAMNTCRGGGACSTTIQVAAGQGVRLATTTSSSADAQQRFTLTAAGTTQSWFVTTRTASDIVPLPFAFTALDNALASNWHWSPELVPVQGIDTDVDVTLQVEHASAVNAGSAYLYVFPANSTSARTQVDVAQNSCRITASNCTSAKLRISPNERLRIYAYSSSERNFRQKFTVTINGVSADWYMTTAPADDIVPDPFAFTALDRAAVNTYHWSPELVPVNGTNAIVDAYLTVDTTTAVSAGSAYLYVFPANSTSPRTQVDVGQNSCRITASNCRSAALKVSPGERLRIYAYSSSERNFRQKFTVTINGVSADWYQTTQPPDDIVPDPFAFTATENAPVSDYSWSPELVPITGVDDQVDAYLRVDHASATNAGSAYLYVFPANSTAARTYVDVGQNSCRITASNCTSQKLTISKGERLRLYAYSSADRNTRQKFTVSINGVSADWYMTTLPADDIVPDPFAFTATENAPTSSYVWSPEYVPVVGINAQVDVYLRVDNATATNAGSAYLYVFPENSTAARTYVDVGQNSCRITASNCTSLKLTISKGERLRLYTYSSAERSTRQKFTVSINGVSADWSLTTRPPDDIVPNPFAFTATENAAVSTYYWSPEYVPIQGVNADVDAYIRVDNPSAASAGSAYLYVFPANSSSARTYVDVGQNSCRITASNCLSSKLTISPGERLRIYAYSASARAFRQKFTVSINGVSADWYMTTLPEGDTVPDPFSIAPLMQQPLSQTVTSEYVTLREYDTETTLRLEMDHATAGSAGSGTILIYPEASSGLVTSASININSCRLNASNCSATVKILPKQRFVLQTYTPATADTTQRYVVSVEGLSATWAVTTAPPVN